MYKSITIKAGSGGWGGPLTITPTEKCHKILNVTGGGITPVAQKIADMTGAEVVDGFKTGCPDDEVMVAVVDCGGTARCGVYPKKGIFTVNLTPVGQSGPLAQYIQPEIYVSGVTESDLFLADGSEVEAAAEKQAAKTEAKTKEQAKADVAAAQAGQKQGIVVRIGKGVGNVVNKFFAAGRETIDMVIKNILPFMVLSALVDLVILSPTQSLRCVEHFRECSLFPLFVDCRSCHRFWDLELLLHRLLVLCLERSSQQVLFLLSMHFAHYSQSMHRLVETSYRLDFHLEKQSQRQLSLVFRLYCLSV